MVHSKDGSVTALLGASRGASVAVNIMLEVLQVAFPEKLQTKTAEEKLSEMIPFWNRKIENNEKEFRSVQMRGSQLLQLDAMH